jgi:hypothetical protein
MRGIVKRAVTTRAKGKRPSAPSAVVAAAAAGAAVAGITYRVLRS